MQYYRYAKSEIIAVDKAKEAADIARERNDFRIARIEREKLERAQKHAARAAAGKEEAAKKALVSEKQDEMNNVLQANIHGGAGDAANNEDAAKAAKQAAIAAAIERAKAAKAAAASDAPKNIADESPAVKAEIAEIDARRASVGIATDEEMANKEKQAKIAAAIARAKAAKAAAEAAKEKE